MTEPTKITVIDAKQAADLLGLHKSTIYEGARNGEIPHRKVGRRFVFVREVLLEWITSAAHEAPETVRLRDAMKHIAAGNISPSITFARLVLDGATVRDAHEGSSNG